MLPYLCGQVSSDQNASSDSPTVLILDDEPIVRQVARRFLQGSGYGCIEAESVDGALEILQTTPVIAAMLDMRIPDDARTGLDVLTDLRRLPGFRDIPVLIVTGSILTEAGNYRDCQTARVRLLQAGRVLDDREFSRSADGPRQEWLILVR